MVTGSMWLESLHFFFYKKQVLLVTIHLSLPSLYAKKKKRKEMMMTAGHRLT